MLRWLRLSALPDSWCPNIYILFPFRSLHSPAAWSGCRPPAHLYCVMNRNTRCDTCLKSTSHMLHADRAICFLNCYVVTIVLHGVCHLYRTSAAVLYGFFFLFLSFDKIIMLSGTKISLGYTIGAHLACNIHGGSCLGGGSEVRHLEPCFIKIINKRQTVVVVNVYDT